MHILGYNIVYPRGYCIITISISISNNNFKFQFIVEKLNKELDRHQVSISLTCSSHLFLLH